MRERAMAIAAANDDHSAYARATTALSVPQWARYDLRGSLATLEDGVAHARAGPTSRCWPAVRCSACRWCSRGWALRRGRGARARVLRHRRAHAVPARAGAAAGRAHADRGLRGEYEQAEQYAHRALLLPAAVRLPLGGRAVPARAGVRARRPRPVRAGARDARHLGRDRRRARAGERRPLLPLGRRRASAGTRCRARRCPALPRDPMVGATRGRRSAVELAQREGARGDVHAAHDLLDEVEARGGVLIGGTAYARGPAPRRGEGPARRRGRRRRHPRRAIVRARVARRPRAGRGADRSGGDPVPAGRATATRSSCSTPRSPRSTASTWRPTPSGPRSSAAPAPSSGAGRTDRAERRRRSSSSPTSSTPPVSPRSSAPCTTAPGPARSSAPSPARSPPTAAPSSPASAWATGSSGCSRPSPQAIDAAPPVHRRRRPTGLHLHVAVHHGELIVDGDRIYGGREPGGAGCAG